MAGLTPALNTPDTTAEPPEGSVEAVRTHPLQVAQESDDSFVRRVYAVGVFDDQVPPAVTAQVLEDARAMGIQQGIADAVRWGAGYEFPTDIAQNDCADFLACDRNLAQLARSRHEARAHNRVSRARIVRWFPLRVARSYPQGVHDRARLIRLAEVGMEVFTAPGFRPNRSPPKLRKMYRVLHSASNKMIADQHSKGELLLLPTAWLESLGGVHFSPIHWTTKQGKDQGRNLADCSNDPDGGPLNDGDGWVQNRVREEWGDIEHPTLAELMLMVLRMADRHGWESLVLWKMDLAAAFALLKYAPEFVTLLAFALTGGLSAVYLQGMFGWVGTPFAFAVVSRVLQAIINATIDGECRWYVDDLMGVSRQGSVDRDKEQAGEAARGLLGDDAVAEKKWEEARRLVFLGWDVDLDSRLVTMSRKNHLKTLYAFLAIDATGLVSLKELQGLASRASRAAIVCRHMRPFTAAFYVCISAYKGDVSKRRRLTAAAKVDVYMWRAFLCLLGWNEPLYARAIESFRPVPASVRIEYDASLTGFGVVVNVRSGTGGWALLFYAAVAVPFVADVHDSGRQNTNEFVAIVVALLLLRARGWRGFTYEVVGDSVSSLAWCRAEHSKSPLARRALILFTLLSIDLDAMVTSTLHRPGKDNVVCDGLSRGVDPADLGLPLDGQLTAADWGPTLDPVVSCDPAAPFDQWTHMVQFLADTVRWLRHTRPVAVPSNLSAGYVSV